MQNHSLPLQLSALAGSESLEQKWAKQNTAEFLSALNPTLETNPLGQASS